MQQSDLKPAKQFALQFGVKSVVYGGPGKGKTPICAETAPKPLLLASEPGLLTLRKSEVPTYPAFNSKKVEEFFAWFFGSTESKNFDTLIWDSVSQACEQLIIEQMSTTTKGGNEQHGLRAYGLMARTMYDYLNKLYFMPNKHIILIAKQGKDEDSSGVSYCKPYFPGKDLGVRVPHLYDLVMRLDDYNIVGVTPSPTKAFRCKESFDHMARDRSGNLAEFEPPHVGKIFTKCMS